MRTILTTVTLATLALLLLGAAPPLPEVDEAEEEKLAAGKLVLRSGIDGNPWKMLGIIEINATPERCWKEILDFDARLAENGAAKAYDMYRDETAGDVRTMAARWDLKILGQEITYYNIYVYDESDSHLTFYLDSDEDSDIVKADGDYVIVPSPINEGGTRFFYFIEMDSGRNMPDSFREFLSNHSLKEMLKAIKTRAEL
jgi:hypothetical protein